MVVAWLAAFWESALDAKSTLACARSPTNCDNGRYSVVTNQLFAARNCITLAQSHLNCQLPYGYIHLILLIIHATCLANTLYSGIQLGTVLREDHVGPPM